MEMTPEEEEEEAEEEEEQIGVEEERKIGEGKEDVAEEDVTLRPRMVLIMRMMEAITKGGAEVCFFFRLYYEFFCPQNLESFFFSSANFTSVRNLSPIPLRQQLEVLTVGH